MEQQIEEVRCGTHDLTHLGPNFVQVPTDGHVSLLCSRVVRMQYIQYGCPWGMALIGCVFFLLARGETMGSWIMVGLICVSRGLGRTGANGEHLKVLSGQDLQFTVDSEF